MIRRDLLRLLFVPAAGVTARLGQFLWGATGLRRPTEPRQPASLREPVVLRQPVVLRTSYRQSRPIPMTGGGFLLHKEMEIEFADLAGCDWEQANELIRASMPLIINGYIRILITRTVTGNVLRVCCVDRTDTHETVPPRVEW